MVRALSFLGARTWVVGSMHYIHSSVGIGCEHPILCAGWSAGAGGRLLWVQIDAGRNLD